VLIKKARTEAAAALSLVLVSPKRGEILNPITAFKTPFVNAKLSGFRVHTSLNLFVVRAVDVDDGEKTIGRNFNSFSARGRREKRET
jgi:hypothetical protein